jgi:phosphate transport system substrate-binding protein
LKKITGEKEMRIRDLIIGLALTGALIFNLPLSADDATINGAGATFPNPLYMKWSAQYYQLTGVKINYQSIGSGGGIAQIKAKTVSFGGTDEPLTAKEQDENGLVMFPMVMGGVVPVVNIEGIKAGQMKLDGETLADIFLGKITKWDDPKIKALNPDFKLPNKPIAVVHRSDGSGTTWLYTNYLAKVSDEFNKKIGNGKSVSWPSGNFYGGKGNEGVSSYVMRLRWSIGYVEYAYALQNKLAYVQLKNKAGKFVKPGSESFQAASVGADWKNSKGFYVILTDQLGDESWPITGVTYILIHKDQPDAKVGAALLKYFEWCFNNGGKMAEELDYVPMPKPVIDLVMDTLRTQIKSGGSPLLK